MFESFGRSFKLIGESFSVLRKDKELLLFPVASGLLSFAVILAFVIPLILVLLTSFTQQAYFWIVWFVLYYSLAFISMFFTAGLIGAANIRLRGKDPKFSDGIRIALQNFYRIAAW